VPKIVDHEQRRRELGDAVLRVVRRDGLSAATVRAVAAEAHTSAGALRHYFATQSELLEFAMRRVSERVRERIANLHARSDHRERAVLAELLPLDDQRRAEAEVWLAFVAQSQVDPAMRQLCNETHAGLRSICRWALDSLATTGRLRGELDGDDEVRRLHALLDGLVLHQVLRPEHLNGADSLRLLAEHLASLAP